MTKTKDYYRLEKDFRFEASHQLPNHDGKCKRLHGHSWKGTVILEGESLIPTGPKQGMLIDYGDISGAIKALIDNFLDHYHLNDSLNMANPTSEAVAKWVFDMLQAYFGKLLKAVRIEETCTARCEYSHKEVE